MPIVKTEKINLWGMGTGIKQREFIIKYVFNPKEKHFEAAWPTEISAALSTVYATGHTFEEVRKAYFAGIDRFKAFETKTTRVILYNIQTSYHTYASSSDALSIYINAGVYDEQETKAPNGTAHYNYIPVEGGFKIGNVSYTTRWDERRTNQLPYNERNEKFFLYIKENMENLIKAILSITESPIKLAEFIDAGRLLPVGENR